MPARSGRSIVPYVVAADTQRAQALAHGSLGPAAEDYVVGMGVLVESGLPVTGVQLAKLLHVSQPSVTQMMRRLWEAGLVAPRSADRGSGRAPHRASSAATHPEHSGEARPFGGFVLTDQGAQLASWLLLRRRVCECFMVDGIGLDWASAFRAADKMEHGLTTDSVRQLHRTLGSPTYCPHGNHLWLDHLPDPTGTTPASTSNAQPLGTVPVGTSVVVGRLSGLVEHDPELLAYLQKSGVAPGRTLVVEDASPQGDAFSIRQGRKRCVLPSSLAAQITVRTAVERRLQPPDQHPLPAPCKPASDVRITAVQVDGPCESGHRPGDAFVLGPKTPAGLCSASYVALLPCAIQVLNATAEGDATAGAAADRRTRCLERRCPGDGYVVWRVEPIEPVEPSGP
ncbi:MAG: FeoA domain-containing protein [Chloroflexi bacterium]|nr:FeoA domain-containing protein [Chloroflexota bacterium]